MNPADDNLGMATPLKPQASDTSLVRFQSRAPELLDLVRGISVIDNESYVDICNYKVTAADILKTLKVITDDIKHTHKAALDSALNPWSRVTEPLEEAVALAERKRKEYRTAQEQKQTDELIAKLNAAKDAAEDEARRNAALLTAAGHPKAAEAILAAPVHVPPVVMPPAVPKVKGIRNVKTWKVAVTDPDLFVRTIGAALLLETKPLDPVVVKWLEIEADGVKGDALAALFKDTEPAGLTWLKNKAVQQKEAFNFPGVAAWQE